MKKIPTLFERDPDNRKYVLPTVTPGCEWVMAGEGTPTRKFDGTCVKLDRDGNWWARREVKAGKDAPADFVQEQHDEVTGKTVGWEPAEQSGFARWLDDALLSDQSQSPGTYELCGPKVNGNPEGYSTHVLIPHGEETCSGLPDPLTFEGLRTALLAADWEGVVWHHPDGRMVKLKKRDFPAGRKGIQQNESS